MAGISQADLDNRFTYHAPKTEQIPKFAVIRKTAKELAELIVELCPDGREKSTAITKLEEVVMWANSAIAREGASGG